MNVRQFDPRLAFRLPPARMLPVAGLLFFSLFSTQSALVQAVGQEPDAGEALVESEAADASVEENDAMLTDEQLAAGGAPAHNAWMLISCALVMFMTAPGLAMFYGGLVRKKNVLSVMMQCIFLMAMMTCLWALIGYSLAFGGSSPILGNLDYLFMRGVARVWDEASGQPLTPMAGEIPRLTHMLFQGMFFIITPALICGAFAERMKFSAMALFCLLWGLVVYCPLAHWVWGGGILAYGQPHSWFNGALDFAGGTVVHLSSGISALVAALVIGHRTGYRHEPMPPHNLTYTALGAAMLWFGWFGFNAGSELMVDGITSSAFAATHFAAAAGALSWPLLEWSLRGKPTVLGTSSGAVAGLVCVTPAAGFVGPMSALIMGACAGIVCYFSCVVVKSRFGYDDALDAFGIHGVGGLLGAVLTGVFASRAIWDIAEGQPLGLLEGNASTLVGQVVAALVTILYSVAGSYVLLKIVESLIGLRVTPADERQGLDVSEHGEEGYIFM